MGTMVSIGIKSASPMLEQRFADFVAKVLTHNQRTSDLTDNELVFLRNRFKDGTKPKDISL